jgi:hypothetical protein
LGPKQQSPQVTSRHPRITSLQQFVNSRFQLKSSLAVENEQSRDRNPDRKHATLQLFASSLYSLITPLQEIIEFLHPCDEPRRDFSELTWSRKQKARQRRFFTANNKTQEWRRKCKHW